MGKMIILIALLNGMFLSAGEFGELEVLTGIGKAASKTAEELAAIAKEEQAVKATTETVATIMPALSKIGLKITDISANALSSIRRIGAPIADVASAAKQAATDLGISVKEAFVRIANDFRKMTVISDSLAFFKAIKLAGAEEVLDMMKEIDGVMVIRDFDRILASDEEAAKLFIKKAAELVRKGRPLGYSTINEAGKISTIGGKTLDTLGETVEGVRYAIRPLN